MSNKHSNKQFDVPGRPNFFAVSESDSPSAQESEAVKPALAKTEPLPKEKEKKPVSKKNIKSSRDDEVIEYLKITLNISRSYLEEIDQIVAAKGLRPKGKTNRHRFIMDAINTAVEKERKDPFIKTIIEAAENIKNK